MWQVAGMSGTPPDGQKHPTSPWEQSQGRRQTRLPGAWPALQCSVGSENGVNTEYAALRAFSLLLHWPLNVSAPKCSIYSVLRNSNKNTQQISIILIAYF